jgi:hypothetical protein
VPPAIEAAEEGKLFPDVRELQAREDAKQQAKREALLDRCAQYSMETCLDGCLQVGMEACTSVSVARWPGLFGHCVHCVVGSRLTG